MSRKKDYLIGLGLLTVPAVLILLGLFFPPFLILGVGGLALILPVSYKLLRTPSTRKNSLGEIVAAMRREAGVGPLGTGGTLICFSGIDGSGKTTEAEKVVSELTEAGIGATHVWARWRPFVSYPFMGVLYVLFGWRRKDYHKSRAVRRVWGYFLLVDQILFFVRFIYPHLQRGRVVCIDRYVLDQLVEMRYDGVYREHSGSLIQRWLPTPDVTFLMDVPADVANERKDDTGEMLDRLGIDVEPVEYLCRRRALFEETAGERAEIIDTTRPMSETHSEIMSQVWEIYLKF